MPTAVANYGSDNLIVSSFSYTYRGDGNIASERDHNNVTTTYTYDLLGRLVSEVGGYSRYYSYDNAGNRTQAIVDTSTTISYTYDSDGRLISETSNDGSSLLTTSYVYDSNGSLISENDGDVTNYGYDVWGNMVSAGGATYAYNAQGLRVSKTISGVTDNFVLVGGDVWADSETTYLRGLELISSSDYFYLYNIRGDVIQLLNYSGEVVKTYDYDAYGNELSRDLADENPFRYCGEYYDTETGLIYLRARYYDPNIGRFTSKDIHWNLYNSIYGDNPVKTQNSDDCESYYPDELAIKQSNNQYAYCADNPIMYTDSNGRWIHIAIGVAVGGIISGISNAAYQWFCYGEIDGWSVVINTAGGAIGGALTAAGFGAISAGIVSGLTELADQGHRNDWDFSKIDVASIIVSAGLGMIGAKIGGSSGNAGHLKSMGKNLFKQVNQAIRGIQSPVEKLLVGFFAFFENLSYYLSQTSTDIGRAINAILKSFIPSSIDKMRTIIEECIAGGVVNETD